MSGAAVADSSFAENQLLLEREMTSGPEYHLLPAITMISRKPEKDVDEQPQVESVTWYTGEGQGSEDQPTSPETEIELMGVSDDELNRGGHRRDVEFDLEPILTTAVSEIPPSETCCQGEGTPEAIDGSPNASTDQDETAPMTSSDNDVIVDENRPTGLRETVV